MPKQIDGWNCSKIDIKLLRKQIAYIPKEPYIMNKSILENLLIANPQAEQSDIKRACTMTGLDEVSMKNYSIHLYYTAICLNSSQKKTYDVNNNKRKEEKDMYSSKIGQNISPRDICSGCSGSCTGNCGNSCTIACGITCTSSCSGSCIGDCSSTCIGGCSNRCSVMCSSSCSSTCSAGCKDGCSGGLGQIVGI